MTEPTDNILAQSMDSSMFMDNDVQNTLESDGVSAVNDADNVNDVNDVSNSSTVNDADSVNDARDPIDEYMERFNAIDSLSVEFDNICQELYDAEHDQNRVLILSRALLCQGKINSMLSAQIIEMNNFFGK